MGSLFNSQYRYNTGGTYGDLARGYNVQQQQNWQQQQGLAQSLNAAMSGAGPSPAQEMLKQATNRNIQQASSQVASQKGINPALAQKIAADNAARSTQEAAAQGATLRAEEQIAARNALQNLYGTMGTQALTGQQQYLGAKEAQERTNAQIEAQNAANNAAMFGGLANAGGAALSMGLAPTPTTNLIMGGGQMLPASNYRQYASKGGKIDGEASVPGDSIENDTVPAMLSPGEIVIPRSKAEDPEKAKSFVDNLMKNKGPEEDDLSYAKILKAHHELKEKVKKLEAKLKGKK
jgi:hypothetical protein